MRDRTFYVNSIKMDLFRVVTATGDVTKPAAVESAKEFLEHALKDFNNFINTDLDITIKENLYKLAKQMYKLDDPYHRLRWSEEVLTNRCRMAN